MFTRVAARVSAATRVLILLGIVGVGSVGYVGYQGGKERIEETFGPPVEKTQAFVSNGWDRTERYADRGLEKIEENPIPILVALGTLLLTIVYHKAKGKTLRQAMEVAVTKVNTIEVERQSRPGATARAQARATYQQLERDQKELEDRLKILPAAIELAKKKLATATAESKAADATAESKEAARVNAERTLANLVSEQEKGQDDLVEIDNELHALLPKT